MEKEKLQIINDVVPMGLKVSINGCEYILDEVMMIAEEKGIYFVSKYSYNKTRIFLSAVDIVSKKVVPIEKDQLVQYLELRKLFGERLSRDEIKSLENLQLPDDDIEGMTKLDDYIYCLLGTVFTYGDVHSELIVNLSQYRITDYSILVTTTGVSLIAKVPEKEFYKGLNKVSLYNNVECIWNIGDEKYIYSGNIVRVTQDDSNFVCYMQPYSMEIMQSKLTGAVTFHNIRNPFSLMDFIVNYSDSDVKGIVYPNSEQKKIQNYIVVGVLENIRVEIDDCSLGNVRFGGGINVSNDFKKNLTYYKEGEYTLVWVSIRADSLYNAFAQGREILQSAVEFLVYMIKNDMFDDWYGTCKNEKGYWDIREHSPQAKLGKVFYIENCILSEGITIEESSMVEPHLLIISEDEEYMLEHEWIERFFRSLEKDDKKIERLQHAIKWVIQAWNTNNKYDRVIYCSMALEFVVNGEKGKNILQEYMEKAEKGKLSKKEKNELVEQIVSRVKLESFAGLSAELLDELNTSIKNMIASKLSEANFGTKLDSLIQRLDIPVNVEERQLLTDARKIRNQLIHGIEMKSITTLEAKKLCGITSRILMYKLQSKFKE